MPRKLTVLVTGATGKQGGVVSRVLLRHGQRVRTLTRKPDSPAAKALIAQGAEVVRGDFDDPASLKRAMAGADTAFLMGTPYEEGGVEAETREAIAAVDAAKAAGVRHIVYTSVASADQNTGIPHFDSKYEVETHLRGVDVPFTIVAPVFFMENLLSPWWLPGLQQGQFVMALPAERPLQQVNVQAVGELAAHLIEQGERFYGKRFDIASDELAGRHAAEILSRVSGRRIEYVEQPLEQVRAYSEDFAIMLEWFDRVGYSADIAALRRDFPMVGWQNFEAWARAQDWGALKQP